MKLLLLLSAILSAMTGGLGAVRAMPSAATVVTYVQANDARSASAIAVRPMPAIIAVRSMVEMAGEALVLTPMAPIFGMRLRE